MPLINAEALGEDLEDHAAPEGEYEMRVVKSEYKETKSGENHMLALALRVEGPEGEGISLVNHYIVMPKDGDAAATTRMRMRDLKRFLVAFGVDIHAGFDPETQAETLVGATGKVRLVQEEYEGNISNKLRLPKAA